MNTKRFPVLCILAVLMVLTLPAGAASFDCGKASRPLEKLICANPELDAADTRLGDVYKQVNAGFPLKGYVQVTQRAFLSGYASCMMNSQGKTSTGPDAVQRCVKAVQERTSQLLTLVQAKVYAQTADKFTHDGLAILVYSANGRNRIQLWGNWMPDAYNPRPFPQGVWCDFDDELKPVKGGFITDSTDDTVFAVTDAAVTIRSHIMCSPRTGIGEGTYRRVR
jgi:uncharacterized protein YecT (DUF1311 family)